MLPTVDKCHKCYLINQFLIQWFLSLLKWKKICCIDKFTFLFCHFPQLASNSFNSSLLQTRFRFASNSFQIRFKFVSKLALFLILLKNSLQFTSENFKHFSIRQQQISLVSFQANLQIQYRYLTKTSTVAVLLFRALVFFNDAKTRQIRLPYFISRC